MYLTFSPKNKTSQYPVCSEGMFPGSKVQLVRGADNLTAIYEPIV
jgi:hypothetical protein